MSDSCESSPTSVLQARRPCFSDALADGFQFFGLGSRLVHKHGTAVVGELTNGFQDVGERPVAAVLIGGLVIGLREPLLGELLDRGDVNVSIVQVFVNVWHVLLQEHPVSANGVPCQGSALSVGDETLDVLENLRLRFWEAEAPLELVQ